MAARAAGARLTGMALVERDDAMQFDIRMLTTAIEVSVFNGDKQVETFSAEQSPRAFLDVLNRLARDYDARMGQTHVIAVEPDGSTFEQSVIGVAAYAHEMIAAEELMFALHAMENEGGIVH